MRRIAPLIGLAVLIGAAGCSATGTTVADGTTTLTTTATMTETVTSEVVKTVHDTTTILSTASSSPATSSSSKAPYGSSAADNSRGNPAPAGVPGHFGDDWTVSLGNTDLDAWPEIQKESRFADAPPAGEVYVSALASVTYNGEGNEDPAYNLRYAFVGSKGNVFDQLDHDCGFGGPSGFIDVGELFSGASGSGTLCARVPQDQVDDGVWRIQYTDMDTFDQIEGFFALS